MSRQSATKRSVYGLPVLPVSEVATVCAGGAAGAGAGAGCGVCAAGGGAAGAAAGALVSSRMIGWSVAGAGVCAPGDCALGSTQAPQMQTATATEVVIAAVMRRPVISLCHPVTFRGLLADERQVVDEDVVVRGRNVDLELDAVELRGRDVGLA